MTQALPDTQEPRRQHYSADAGYRAGWCLVRVRMPL